LKTKADCGVIASLHNPQSEIRIPQFLAGLPTRQLIQYIIASEAIPLWICKTWLNRH
jgi:hypothetical protein